MIVRRVTRLLFVLFALTACSPAVAPQSFAFAGQRVLADVGSDSGVERFTTPEIEIFRNRTGIFVARPVILQKGPHRRYAILINARRRSPNAPIIETVASGRQILDYQRHDRVWSHCIDGCQRAEVGAVTVDAETFRRAAKTGFPLLVAGKRQSYEGTLPAAAFARVLRDADATRRGERILPQVKDRLLLGPRPEH